MDISVRIYRDSRLKERRLSPITESHLTDTSRRARWTMNPLRVWAVCFALVGAACTQALACFGPSSERTIIFRYAPTDVDASIIVEVTIEERERDILDPKALVPLTAVMKARVERVIKGQVSAKTLRIVTGINDCIRDLEAGNKGFVAGELRNDSNGDVELVAISENYRKANVRPN
jgi:hypothetical protein